jgi:predicted TIM-barrel fold metal-dependent hydrolase
MIIDGHVHISAFTPGHGSMSPALLKSIPFTFMRWRFGLDGNGAADERAVRELLFRTIDATNLDAAAVLGFDGVYDLDGNFDQARTHLFVTNDYVIELAAANPKIIFAASIHPYRKDAVAEIERCAAAGAALVKWLPIVQDFNPAHPKCIPFYEALAHFGILLSHTGTENALPNLDRTVADPMLLQEAVRRGVKVIAAHCGSRLLPWEIDYFPNWAKLARDHEHFYGDTAALNVPGRGYVYDTILRDETLRKKLVHGSDWPIIAIPQPLRLGWPTAWKLFNDPNWMRRDLAIKQRLGLDDAYWHRAGTILKIPEAKLRKNTPT